MPIVHTMADMGSKSEALKQESIRRFGVERWERSRQVIEEVWEGIRARLLALTLPWDQVRIYQDGLPVSRKELEIARDVAAQGSRNYQLILELLERGAQLMGTEDPVLLREEYALVSAMTDAGNEAPREQARAVYAREGPRILKERDEFISRRINETLKEGQVGLLFLGLLHEVDRLLLEGIEVEYLIHRLPFRASQEM